MTTTSATIESFVANLNPRNRNYNLQQQQRSKRCCDQSRRRISIVARTSCSSSSSSSRIGIGIGIGIGTHRFVSSLDDHTLLCRRRSSKKSSSNSLIVPFFSASQLNHHHDDSEHSEIDVEKKKSDVEVGAEESDEAWKKMLESFKEHAIKMQGMSQEAYEVYSKKAIVILKETSEQLKIHADKATHDLSKLANEISVEGKEYLSAMAENSPEEVKDIVETFASPPNDLKEVSKVQDFYFGIPYGALLSLGGFLSFMLTGSTSAIRFGVILGGTLLALSISSLRSWKRGESSPLALKGQAVIAGIIFLRYLRILFQRLSFSSCFTALISGGMVAFYLYRIRLDGEQKKGRRSEHGQDS